ncbi:GerMN domain-containing protein [Tepidibacter formicigenes]|uniref:Sporulation and spore germination n=1 Tax=Tepidibacter formicigenes DSM 15518 TaxID=1123349 RepID=A0A1M6LYU8_9FIRM|nr:GerMN domain-containing protein [Tepidibacter formicigenes]SHJ76352.1 Sporulation and spore germination [Tepidibacter formicigenes DSM 15518]
MKRIYYTLLILTLMLSVVGCSEKIIKDDTEKQEIKLYYSSLDNSKIQWVTRSIEYSNDMEKYNNTIKALINGPYSSDMIRSINENTQILSIEKKKGILYLDLSKEFLEFKSDINQVNAVITISNTLNQFKEIEALKITVEGKELISLDGQPYGILKEFNLSEEKKISVQLYFPDENMEYLIPYKKNVELKDGYKLGKKIVEEIIKESNKQGYNIIPKGTKLLNYSEEKGIATVNFSKEFINNYIGGSAGETMTIYSIVNSLTELENISSVLFLIEGKKVDYFSHYEFNKPFTREESLIKTER